MVYDFHEKVDSISAREERGLLPNLWVMVIDLIIQKLLPLHSYHLLQLHLGLNVHRTRASGPSIGCLCPLLPLLVTSFLGISIYDVLSFLEFSFDCSFCRKFTSHPWVCKNIFD